MFELDSIAEAEVGSAILETMFDLAGKEARVEVGGMVFAEDGDEIDTLAIRTTTPRRLAELLAYHLDNRGYEIRKRR